MTVYLIFFVKLELKILTGVGVDNKFLTINNNLSRAMSDGSKEKFIVNYNDVVKAQGNNNILIIDVRENNEIQDTGKLPDSIHIPSKF